MSLLERVDAWGLSDSDRPAHVSRHGRLTYGELTRRADAVAAHLARALPEDRAPVAVLGHKEPEVLIAFLGALRAGRAYVPIDTVTPAQRVGRVVTAAAAPVMLTPESVAAITEEAGAAPRRDLGPDDPFYIMFTSGSTGDPKGVVITLGCLTSYLDWLLAEQNFEEGEHFLNVVPYSFDVSVMDTYAALATGGTIYSVTREDVANPRQLYPFLADAGLTTWVSTPSFAQMCLVERSFSAELLPRLRRFLFCGETLAPEVAARLLDRFPAAQVWNTYGPTETTVAVTSLRIDRDMLARWSPLPIGRPMPGSRVVVVDEADRPVPDGKRGQIVIAGPSVSPGYLGRPDLTERGFFRLGGLRAYRTGDWGRYRDGLLFFEGRMDGQIKLHGYRIELADVEANLRALPGVRDAVVLPVLKQGAADSLAAFVILNERPAGSDFQAAAALRSQLAERLPAYMLPRKVHFLETFPMNANGKADRRRLAEVLATKQAG
ncbi:MAG TPA: D-alanine--poly(phosphoribitol) ligase subunit DltA [Gemmataceae bacterium]|nr:D-alanine--poly(phosphoribitol) ligase subunit DltA [Gemmataceae bacterium]